MFPAALSPLNPVDIALLAALALAFPPWALFAHLREKRREAEGRPRTRVQKYHRTIVMLWLMAGVVLAAWLVSGRPVSELGLTAPAGLFFAGGMALSVGVSAALLAQIVIVARNENAQASVRKRLQGQTRVHDFVPTTPAEIQVFRLLAITAGVAEEVVFRGFMIWGLAHWMHPVAAAALSLAIFTAGHLYQESPGALARVALVGLVLTLFVMLSGSLWPAILLHAAIDLSSGEITHIAMRRRAAARG